MQSDDKCCSVLCGNRTLYRWRLRPKASTVTRGILSGAEGQWNRMNDGVTYPCSFAKVRAEAAYMLFYCRTTTRTYTTRADQVCLLPPPCFSPPAPLPCVHFMLGSCAPQRPVSHVPLGVPAPVKWFRDVPRCIQGVL